MTFFAVNGPRPIRLSEGTRRFAHESLQHKYGLMTKETPCVSLDDIHGFDTLSDLEKYDLAVERIASEAPIRVCDGEKISGAATLGDAISHFVPARYRGALLFSSVSHLTVDFETVLKHGVKEIERQVIESLEVHTGTDKEPFLRSCLRCLGAMKVWHRRYLDGLSKEPAYQANFHNLTRVPFEPATNFYEAVQSLWFTFAFLRLCGNWPGIGRIDVLLGSYLEKDLSDGRIGVNEAREILAHFFIKGCEWITGESNGSGDAQHYQNILLGGIDEDGKDVTNTVTYLVLDILEELGISDFPTTVRINTKTEESLLRRVAEVIRLGGGILAVYNEGLIIDSLVKYGYDPKEARRFGNDGCWEIQIPGKTYFTYVPLDSLWVLQHKTLKDYNGVAFDRFGDLLDTYLNDLYESVRDIKTELLGCFTLKNGVYQSNPTLPCTVVSLFEQGCIRKGKSYFEGGPIYNVVSPHIGGLPDTANALYAIKKLVFDERRIAFSDLMTTLRENWQDNEVLRQYALNRYSYYGNDNDEVDSIAAAVFEAFADACDEAVEALPLSTPAGVSTFGRQIEWSHYRIATPFGKKANAVLSGNDSPTPGTDREGATAVIRSFCKADLTRAVSGAALDLKLLPTIVNGENGIEALIALIRGFVTLGGHFMQLDIADAALLHAAQENPEEYQSLSVRVSGWNARFVTLNKEWQDMIIARTEGNAT